MIIVTGIAGFIGSQLANAIHRHTSEVICGIEDVDAINREGRVFIAPHVNSVFDWRGVFSRLDSIASEVSAVFHLGAITDTRYTNVTLLDRQNIVFTIGLWNWCARHGKPLVYASSAATYGNGQRGFSESVPLNDLDPLNLYACSKHLADMAIRANSEMEPGHQPPHWYGLKLFNVYGPGEEHKGEMRSVVSKWIGAASSGQKLDMFSSARSSKRDFVYVDDVVASMIWMMEHRPPSGLYNIGSGQAESFIDVASAVLNAFELPLSKWMNLIDMPDEMRGGYQHHTQADIGKLRSAGYDKPYRSIEDGIASMLK